jgi:mono/diheme cytochrome c family protein
MSKARPKPKAPPPQSAPEPVARVVEAEEGERASRRTILTTAAVVLASLAATILLLSGWTPGPGTPAPQRVAASTAAARTAAPKKKAAPKKTIKAKPRKRAARVPPTTRQVSKQLFQEDCGFCHTLAAAGTTGRVGPNLDKLRPGRRRVLDAIAAGGRRTGLMPPDILTGSDALNLAIFVAEATRR